MTPRALVYFTQFTTALGGSEYIPLTFVAELQKRCRVTLALNWRSDVARAARTMGIPVDMDALEVVTVKPEGEFLRKLDAILPFYRTRRLKKLAQNADICISTVNMFDFGKPAHHFVFLLRHFGDNAFFGCFALASDIIRNGVLYHMKDCSGDIVIPDGVTKIGNGAFAGCTRLASVVIPNSVTKIGRNAFRSCFGLTSVAIPDSVTEIGDFAFQDCPDLTEVVIPGKTTLGKDVFDKTTIVKKKKSRFAFFMV